MVLVISIAIISYKLTTNVLLIDKNTIHSKITYNMAKCNLIFKDYQYNSKNNSKKKTRN